MKKDVKVLGIVIVVLCTTYVFAGTAVINLPSGKIPKADSIFLRTHWKQMGGFELYAPDKLRLGCWSTAFAQIMYYHNLKPFGHIAYTSTHGYKINADLDSVKINMGKLATGIDDHTVKADIEALAQYNYYAAMAVQKDFGTDNYMHKLASAKMLGEHYKVKVSRYISWKGLVPYTSGKLERVISKEIHNKRPVFLHFSNMSNFGHSVVIDGYKQMGKAFMVHLNQGQGGPQDGWYNFDHDILKEGDRGLRVIYTFKPI